LPPKFKQDQKCYDSSQNSNWAALGAKMKAREENTAVGQNSCGWPRKREKARKFALKGSSNWGELVQL